MQGQASAIQVFPQSLIVFHEAIGLFAFRHFGQRVARVSLLAQQADEFAIGITAGKFGNVAVANEGAEAA